MNTFFLARIFVNKHKYVLLHGSILMNQASLSSLGTYLNAKVSCSFFGIQLNKEGMNEIIIGLFIISLYYVLTSYLTMLLFLYCIYLRCRFLRYFLEKRFDGWVLSQVQLSKHTPPHTPITSLKYQLTWNRKINLQCSISSFLKCFSHIRSLSSLICLLKSLSITLSLVMIFIRFSLHFICSGTPDFAFGVLKILILLYIQEVLQPAIEQFAPGMMWTFSSSVSLSAWTNGLIS